jgi:hypothetical protein
MRALCYNLPMILGICLGGATWICTADDSSKKQEKSEAAATSKPGATPAKPEGFPPPPNARRLTKDYDIWLDSTRRQLIVDGSVVLREGLLEMFACPKQTKEHESIVAVNCKAQFVHAGLLALGVEPGQPVKFDPEYKPASGPIVDVWVLWKDEKGNHKALAQEWIQQAETGKQMEYPFVFAGSGFHVDEVTGEKHYLADGGDMICVSNFTSATLDLPVASSQDNNGLVFRAFTERIPPLGTPVRLVLAPKLKDKAKEKAKGEIEPPSKKPDSTKDSK